MPIGWNATQAHELRGAYIRFQRVPYFDQLANDEHGSVSRGHLPEWRLVMDLQLTDKTALVTGATGGIGLEIARRLSIEGANVIIAGRNKDRVELALESIRRSGGGKVRGITADLATAEGIETLLEAVQKLDILINNLGIYEAKNFADISDEDWLRIFEVNVLSGVRLSRAYFSGMLSRNWGRVIFVSSEAAKVTPEDMIHYAVTKNAQLSLSRGLAALTKGTDVTVNAILPGPTRSVGSEDFLRGIAADPAATSEQIEAEFFAKYRTTSLLQRMIDAKEIANLAAYIASPLSSATNGAAIHVEGGTIPTNT